MRTPLLLLVLLAGPVLANQTVWKWVDEKGVTHYSDRPVPGATEVQLNVSSRWDSTQPRAASPGDSASPPQDEEDEAAPGYSTFEIWKPSPEETIPNTAGQITVNVRVEPGLQPGHSILLYLDGELVEGFPGDTQEFALTEVPRGAHTAVAVIADSRGQRVQQTAPVRFYVQQVSATQPPVGPALRPPRTRPAR